MILSEEEEKIFEALMQRLYDAPGRSSYSTAHTFLTDRNFTGEAAQKKVDGFARCLSNKAGRRRRVKRKRLSHDARPNASHCAAGSTGDPDVEEALRRQLDEKSTESEELRRQLAEKTNAVDVLSVRSMIEPMP